MSESILDAEYKAAAECAMGVLLGDCNLDPMSIQALIAHHLIEHGDALDPETQMILRGSMVALIVMHGQFDAMAAQTGMPPYRSETMEAKH